jgi:DNA polymerase-1
VDGRDTFYVPIGHRDSWLGSAHNVQLDPYFLTHVGAPYLFFNAKFDIHVLINAGYHFPEELKFFDTMIMCHMIEENEKQYSLERMAQKYVGAGKVSTRNMHGKDILWEDIPQKIMAIYACQDAKVTYDLYMAVKDRFELYLNQWEKYDSKFLWCLQRMEKRGVITDLEKAAVQKAMCTKRIAEIDFQLGFNPKIKKILHSKLFDDPPVGYGLKPLTRTKKRGDPQVNIKFYENTNHPVCGLLLERSKLEHLVTAYYQSYENLCGGYGRLHASYLQHGTVTGRLSCKNPNMQQIPRESPIKSLFLPDEGKELWEIDYANLEMRIAAVYSKEPALLDIFRSEGDVHQLTADLLGISRQFAKVINFLIIYGGGAPALSTQLGVSIKEGASFLRGFDEAYPRLKACRDAATEAVYGNGGYVKMWSGRRRHFRFESDYHKAFNSLCQGGGFEIVKRGMVKLGDKDIVNQVHDSVWIQVNKETAQEEVKEAEMLLSDWTKPAFGLHFRVDSKRLAA